MIVAGRCFISDDDGGSGGGTWEWDSGQDKWCIGKNDLICTLKQAVTWTPFPSCVLQCLRASEFTQRIDLMWRNGIPSCIDILLFPDCVHGIEEAQSLEGAGSGVQENSLLLERWNIQCIKKWWVPAAVVGGGPACPTQSAWRLCSDGHRQLNKPLWHVSDISAYQESA